MDLSAYLTQLREDLTTAASAGDDQTRQTAAVLSAAIEPAARLAIMNALSDLAAEVTTQLDGQVVDVRLDGRDVDVVVTGSGRDQTEPAGTTPPPPPAGDAGDVSRITLRLLEQIKSQAEQAASTQGVSLNTWLAQAVQGALHSGVARGTWPQQSGGARPGRWGSEGPGSHVHGWVHG
ncbi:toxin-antitoxin system HicB family antitoxin [Allosaccharopolyspora coralli]|uniref:Toxin-antitoxin system HicB family antitoxin n=1 Tax=Allosaccharopolyspora coralli TaxID=2665642 RepID=A0A5Q3QAP6_9PSEU|nr:toxin-antitoxin system HicB family antitoxin [Allosaccharopolyspora coralli]QGK70930.1 toxin-antitoxin system HicB family antitoxin [Allosaccharopolyspora coralli]